MGFSRPLRKLIDSYQQTNPNRAMRTAASSRQAVNDGFRICGAGMDINLTPQLTRVKDFVVLMKMDFVCCVFGNASGGSDRGFIL